MRDNRIKIVLRGKRRNKENLPKDVFINCPIDPKYEKNFQAICFTIMACGYRPYSSLVFSGTRTRMERIYTLISECPFSIHDISRKGLYGKPRLPRFNMPFEYGVTYTFNMEDKNTECIVIDKNEDSYIRCFSDIKDKDVLTHHDEIKIIIGHVRNFLQSIQITYFESEEDRTPETNEILTEFNEFFRFNPRRKYLTGVEYSFNDLKNHADDFLQPNDSMVIN